MVRLSLICVCAVSPVFGATRDLPRREHAVVTNVSYAIAEYKKAYDSFPGSLLDIKEYTDLRFDFNHPDVASFPQQYALLQPPRKLAGYGEVVLISTDTLVSGKSEKGEGSKGRLIGFIKADGTAGGVFIEESMAAELVPHLTELKPIGGTLPAPSWAKPPSKEPVMSETMKRALEMQARGELPTPPRRDKEAWRDEKPPAPLAPTPTPAVTVPAPAKTTNPLWWLFGAIAALASVVVFVTRKKKPKT